MKLYDAVVGYATRDGSYRTMRMFVRAPTMVKARKIAAQRTASDGRRRVREVKDISLKRLEDRGDFGRSSTRSE